MQNWPRILVFPCLRDSLTPGVFPATGSRWKLKKEREIVGRRIEEKCYATTYNTIGISSFLARAQSLDIEINKGRDEILSINLISQFIE